MPEPASNQFPEFVLDLVAKQGDALLAKLRGNSELEEFFGQGDGIQDFESELLFDVEGRMSIKAPFLGVSLGPVSQPVAGSGGMVEKSVAFDLFFITKMPTAKSTQHWLRSRLMGHVARLLASDFGVLYDVDSPTTPLTDALTRVERIDFRGRLVGTNLIATVLRVTYGGDQDRLTDEFLS